MYKPNPFYFNLMTCVNHDAHFKIPFSKLEFIYNAVQLVFTWTSLANFYLAFFFVSCFETFLVA